jgi:hypothetical protein
MAMSLTHEGEVTPNGVRLSCAATLEGSQVQFYYNGRRQLQPHVRRHAQGEHRGSAWQLARAVRLRVHLLAKMPGGIVLVA